MCYNISHQVPMCKIKYQKLQWNNTIGHWQPNIVNKTKRIDQIVYLPIKNNSFLYNHRKVRTTASAENIWAKCDFILLKWSATPSTARNELSRELQVKQGEEKLLRNQRNHQSLIIMVQYINLPINSMIRGLQHHTDWAKSMNNTLYALEGLPWTVLC